MLILAPYSSRLCPRFFVSCAAIEFENSALVHQISVLRRSARKRGKIYLGDRLLWVGYPAPETAGARRWPVQLAGLLFQFLATLCLIHFEAAALFTPAVEGLYGDLDFLAGLWGDFLFQFVAATSRFALACTS